MMTEEKQKVLEAAGWRVGDAEMFVGECGACVVVGHNAPDGVLPDAPIYRRQPRPEGCEDCSGCPDCYTNEKPCDCRDADEMIIRPVSAYADNGPPLDPPTEEDIAARRKWADRHVAVLAASPPVSARATAPFESVRFQGDPNTVLWWATGSNLDFSQGTTERKLNLKLDDLSSPPAYHNPLAALRRERKVKSGKAAKLLGVSRQRLHVVEHATKPLRCMGRLLAKAAEVWPVVDETATKTAPHGGT